MVERKIVYLLALVVGTTAAGCSYTATVRVDEARSPRSQVKVSHVDVRLAFSSIKEKSGQWVQFDRSGGRFLPNERMFSGRTPEGDTVRLALSEMESAVVYVDYPPGAMLRTISSEEFVRDSWKSGRRVADVVEPRGQRIMFDSHRGHFSPDEDQIKGLTKSGEPISIPVADVATCWIREKRFSYVRTILLIAIPVGLVVGVGLGMGQVGLGGGGGGSW